MQEAIATQDAPTDTADERRGFGRHRVMLSAQLITPLGRASVVLLGLSEGGATVSAPLPIARGSAVVLARGLFEAHGEVVWTEGRRIGIRFDEAVDEARIETVVAPARMSH